MTIKIKYQDNKPIFKVTNKNGIGEVLLYTDIGGWFGITSREFIDEVSQLGNVKNVDLRISSEGGDVVTAIDIFNAIRRHPATWTAYIDGFALSAASWIPLATNKVVMADNAQMMIHRVQGVAIGNPEEVRKMADVWEDIENTAIISAYRTKTGLTRGELIDMMDAETWMNAQTAFDYGFIDEISGAMDVAACASLSGHYQYRNAPKRLANKPGKGNPNKQKIVELKQTVKGVIS